MSADKIKSPGGGEKLGSGSEKTTVTKMKGGETKSGEWIEVLGPEPLLVSQFLIENSIVTASVAEAYDAYAQYVFRKGNSRKKQEANWLSDYMENIVWLHSAKSISRKAETSGEEEPTPPASQGSDFIIKEEEDVSKQKQSITTIRLNELVIKPESFDGIKPHARRWIDDYEKASRANGWKEIHMTKYFATFLEKSAYDWFLTLAQKRLGDRPSWAEVRACFIRHFLGESDRMAVRRQIEKTFQREKESITTFMPRLLRLIQLIDPNKPEDELAETVKEKLRPEYQEKLAMHTIFTLEELNDLCLKVEAGVKAANTAAKRQATAGPQDRRRRNFRTDKEKDKKNDSTGKKPNDNRPYQKRKPYQCYRCDRLGHIAPKCKFESKADGSPLNQKPINKSKSINAVEKKEEKDTPAEQSKPTPPSTVGTVRPAGKLHLCTLYSTNLAGTRDKFGITQDLICNGAVVTSLVDTGALKTVVSFDIASQNEWKLEKAETELTDASGKPLDCVGEAWLKIELHIGKKFMVATHKVPVIRNLCAPMLLGLELLRSFQVNIDVTAEKPLSFKKGTIPIGLVAKQDIIIPSRTGQVITAKINTQGTLIATVPYGFENGLLLANSVSRVVNKEVDILVVNIDTQAIQVKENQRVGSFEVVQDDSTTIESKVLNSINAVLQLADTGETVKIGEQLNVDQVKDLRTLFEKFIRIFATNNQMGSTKLIEHRIVLEPNARPFVEPSRRHPRAHAEEAERQVTQMLKQGIIEHSKSPWASEYVMVKKKTGEWRLCIDFRRLNALTKKDCFPLPNIESCVENLAGNLFYSQLDFASGYWQLPVAADSQEYTAFRTDSGLYHFKKMPFGLCNAPASFQRLINAMFAGMRGLSLQVFLDDVCLATKSWAEHIIQLEKVFGIIEKANLKLNPSKCVFGAAEVTFLGHRLNQNGIHQDPNKLKALIHLPRPQDVPALRRILGAFGYYRRFVPRYSLITAPLTKLLCKNVPFDWNMEHETAFKNIKDQLKANATLAFCNDKDPIIVKTDASLAGVAGLLLQEIDGNWKIVTCASRNLTASEKNYSITELEGLAIVYAVTKFRYYLLGRFFQILTDHCALCVLNAKEPQNKRLRRWALILSEFHFKIVYTKGSLHKDIDCLSRAPVEDIEDPYLEGKILTIAPLDKNTWIKEYNDDEADELVAKALSNQEGLVIIDGILYKEGRLYVPKAKRNEVISDSHDNVLAAHDGVEGTLFRLKDYWWPRMVQTVTDYVTSCHICQKRKTERQKQAGTMQRHESYQPMEVVAFDHMGPLPPTVRGKKFIIVAIDCFTRFVDAKAVADQSSAKFVKFLNEFIGRYGVPRAILSDNAKAYDNASVRGLLDQLNIQQKFATPHHSRGNAQAERVLQTLQEKLSVIINDETLKLDWEFALPSVILSLNTKYHRSTGYAPFQLVYGRKPPVIGRGVERANVSPQDLHLKILEHNLNDMRADAIANSADAHATSRQYFDANHRERVFEVGDLVWTKVKSRSSKLGDRFEGPCEVMKRENDVYSLKILSTGKLIERHTAYLKPYVGRGTPEVNTIMTRAIAFVVATLLIVQASAIILQPAAPVYWTQVRDKYVHKGSEYLTYELVIVSPCKILWQFPRQHIKPIAIVKPDNQIPHLQQNAQSQQQPQPQPQPQLQPQSQQQQPQSQSQSQPQPQPQPQPQLQPSLHPQPQLQPQRQQPRLQQAQTMQYMPPQPPVIPMAPPMVAPGTPVSGQHFSPVVDGTQDDDDDDEDDDTVEKRQTLLGKDPIAAAVDFCELVTENQIIRKLSKFKFHSKEKRQLGFLAGIFFSDILSVFKTGGGITGSRDSYIAEKTRSLETSRSLQEVMNKATEKGLKEIGKEVIGLSNEISQQPLLAAVTANIISTIHDYGRVLDRLYYSVEEGSPDMITLTQITNTTMFGLVEARDAKIENIAVVGKNVLRFTIKGGIRSKDTQVFKAHALNHYANITTSPVKLEYVGKTLFIRNSTSDCWKSIDSTTEEAIQNSCEEKGYRDPQLQLWRRQEISNILEEPKHSTSILLKTKVLIGCWGTNITVQSDETTAPVTLKCPINYFLLDATSTFHTGDLMVNHLGGRLTHTTMEMDPQIILHSVHFNNSNHLNDEMERSLKEIQRLNEANINVLGMAGLQVSHRQINLALSGFLLLIMMSIILRYMLRKVKKIKIPCVFRVDPRPPTYAMVSQPPTLTPRLVEQMAERAASKALAKQARNARRHAGSTRTLSTISRM